MSFENTKTSPKPFIPKPFTSELIKLGWLNPQKLLKCYIFRADITQIVYVLDNSPLRKKFIDIGNIEYPELTIPSQQVIPKPTPLVRFEITKPEYIVYNLVYLEMLLLVERYNDEVWDWYTKPPYLCTHFHFNNKTYVVEPELDGLLPASLLVKDLYNYASEITFNNNLIQPINLYISWGDYNHDPNSLYVGPELDLEYITTECVCFYYESTYSKNPTRFFFKK